MDDHVQRFPADIRYESGSNPEYPGNAWGTVLDEVRARLDDKNAVIADLKMQLAGKDQVIDKLIAKIPAPRADHLAVKKKLAELQDKFTDQQGMVRRAYDVLREDLKTGWQ